MWGKHSQKPPKLPAIPARTLPLMISESAFKSILWIDFYEEIGNLSSNFRTILRTSPSEPCASNPTEGIGIVCHLQNIRHRRLASARHHTRHRVHHHTGDFALPVLGRFGARPSALFSFAISLSWPIPGASAWICRRVGWIDQEIGVLLSGQIYFLFPDSLPGCR